MYKYVHKHILMASCDTLALKHPHERDARISFEEGPHIYTIDGDSNYMSVTTWNHKHFEQFDEKCS